MDKWYIIISGLLLLLAAVLFIRLIQYKRQMRIFAAKLQKRLHGGVDQEIHVEYFDRDIVALAKALNDYSDQIKERNRALEQDRTRLKNVIAGISHDFRTPLTAVKGYLQLMKKGGRIDDRDMEYLDIAIAKTEYLRVLSDAFFEVSYAEAKDEAIDSRNIDVARTLTALVLEQYEWIQESGIQAAFDIPESVVWVQSNEKVLNRIFTNFFSNARKYADTRISVCLQQDADGVSITFTNDIEADNEIDIDHVFDAFYRGNSRREEGAGLGLYVVKCLADKLGHVVSAEVKDKQFSVMLRIK